MKTSILVSIGLFLFSSQIYSQEKQIQARIVDDYNNKPVSFVTVYSSLTTGVISDDEGFFRFNYSEEQLGDSLYFSCIGYGAKAIAISDLRSLSLDTVFMTPQVFRLDEIQVESKSRKKPKSKKIIKEAIAAIPENHPDFPFKLKGYFREYVKYNEDYINLFESIIELSDSGINSYDDFSAGMLFKTASPEFKTDPGLMRPYNNVDKFVPYLVAPNTSNELVLLRNHDPVRKYNQTTLYQIDELESDFIKNHEFHLPRLTYLNDTAYYSISFFNKKPITRGNKEIVAEGTIYISATDLGIKKLSYQTFARDDFGSKKLFDLNLEYKLKEKKYFLNYLSFNNLFMTRNFSISDAHFHTDTIDMIFNQAYDTTGLDQEDFRVFWMDRELEVRDMQMYPDSNMVRLKVDGTEKIHAQYHGQDAFIFKNLGFEIANMADLNGTPLESPGYKEYYQYRELFVKGSSTDNTLISNNLIDKQKPVFETQIFGEMIADFSWINTPLITESFDSRLDILENQVHRTGVENLLQRNEKIINEMVYLHTDREVYAPADTLWFKAYIRDMAKLDTSSLSQTLFVKIVNESGGSIENARFLIENSNARGQFILDHKLKEGVYYITAYTSWMQNYDVDQVQLKKILVRKERRPELQMELVLDRSVYFAGDTIKAVVHCFDEQNRDVDNVKYVYSVEAGKKNLIAGGRARTSGGIQDTLLLIVPEQLRENPEFSILGTHKRQALDTLYRLPVIRDIHINFFPEGGKSIKGMSSNLAFKAESTQGDPIHIEGEIVDPEGKLITKISSEHDGMGVFTITPDRNRPMYLNVTDPPGFDSLYALPMGLDQGWQMSGKVENENIILEVNRQDTPDDIALITLMIRGQLLHYQQIRVKKSENVKIPLKDLPAGIAVLTLFDQNMNPRAERLFYINPTGELDVQMESRRQSYVPRDKVDLEISLSAKELDLLKGSYSLSVVDDQLGYTEFIREPNIRSAFLLSPEIKGKINNPNYYMDVDRPGVIEHLDLLLMTQGWRNYSYLSDIEKGHELTKPRDQEMVSGTLFRQPFGKEELTAAGFINVFYGGSSLKIPLNQNGRFAFTPEYDKKFNSGVLISGVSDPPSSYARLQIDEPHFQKGLPEYLKHVADSTSEATDIPLLPYKSISDQFSLGLTYFQWIEEVEIVKSRNRLDEGAFDAILEDFIVMNKRESGPEDIDGAVDLIGILYNMAIPVEYEPISDVLIHLGYPRAVITWIVDDSNFGTKFGFVQNFVPKSIEKIFVVKGFETTYYGSNITEVVVSIKLKRFDPNDPNIDRFQSKYNIPAFGLAKEFYQPLYNSEEKRKSQIPDLRKTIHWDPELQIGEDGKTTVQFYNGDRYTRIKCILEGITEKGVPVYKEYHYNVSLSRD